MSCLTISTQSSPSEANKTLSNSRNYRLLLNSKIHYRVHNSLPLVLIPSQAIRAALRPLSILVSSLRAILPSSFFSSRFLAKIVYGLLKSPCLLLPRTFHANRFYYSNALLSSLRNNITGREPLTRKSQNFEDSFSPVAYRLCERDSRIASQAVERKQGELQNKSLSRFEINNCSFHSGGVPNYTAGFSKISTDTTPVSPGLSNCDSYLWRFVTNDRYAT